jgi:hypothetical protein
MTMNQPEHDHDPQDWPWLLDASLQSYPERPLVDADSAWVLAQAVTELAVIRCPALGVSALLPICTHP